MATSATAPQLVKADNGVYSLGGLTVVPHPGDEALAAAYFLFKKQHRLRWVFYDNDNSIPSLTWFLTHFQASERIVLACVQHTDSYALEGLGWVNAVESMGEGKYRKCEVGMCFGRRTREALTYGRIMLDWIFDHVKPDLIVGTTPFVNAAAIGYAKSLGFELIGPMPNYCCVHGQLCDAYFSAMTRARWQEVRSQCPGLDTGK